MDLKLIYLILGIILVISIVLIIVLKNKKANMILGTILCVIFIIGGSLGFKPLLDIINYGIDLQGGFEILYQVSPLEEDTKLDSDMVYNTYKSLQKRIDILGVSEPEITIEGEDRIRIKLAGVTNKEEAREILSSTASLTFRDTNDMLLMTADVLGGNAKVTRDSNGKPAVSLNIGDKNTFYDITSKVSKMDNNVIVIWLDYDASKDSYSSEKNTCGSLSSSHCLSAATVRQGFASDVIIQGNFSQEEAESLVELINSGALPTQLTELSSRTIEATFGANSLNQTLVAGLVGIILVCLIIMLVYRFSGFVASLGVVIYTLLSFLLFYLIGGVLTLPGIAAMLLGIGMAVDANVISFERIKENLKKGNSLKEAFSDGVKSSLSSIIDANITTLIVAIVLFIFGESSVKGFATMLMINIVSTILVMVVLVKLMLGFFVKTKFFDDKLGLFIGVNKKKIVKSKEVRIPFEKVNFVKVGKRILVLPIILIVVGSIIALTTGVNLGVDFTGGTSITLNVTDSEEIQKLTDELQESKYTLKKTEKTNSDVTITIDEVLDKDEIKTLTEKLENEYDTDTDIYTVSKLVKQELTKNAIYSLLIACIGIVIYVSIRFKFNYAISALVALFHDVLLTVLFFLVFKVEITTIFIAAVLTIIGYSINDTIVTFDMIRENYKNKYKNNIKDKETLKELVNMSVRRTFFRNILTTVTTIVPVICLMILGAREIVNFNLALLVGFIVGVFSSIFISNQIWLWLEEKRITRKPKEKKKKIDDDEPNEIKIKGVNC